MACTDVTATDPVVDVDEQSERVRSTLLDDLDDGFAELVGAYQDVVFSVALRTTGHRADAEDLAAESLLRAYRALSGYDTERLQAVQPRSWLLTIVLNTRRNQVRDAARRPRVGDAVLPERAGTGPGVEEAALRRETSDELVALLEHLPGAQRTAVVLRHVADLPIGEVAAVLGCPTGTAKSHVSRGLTRLRALMADPHALDLGAEESQLISRGHRS